MWFALRSAMMGSLLLDCQWGQKQESLPAEDQADFLKAKRKRMGVVGLARTEGGLPKAANR